MDNISELPELLALECPPHVIRIPDQIDVPFTDRIKRLVDSAAFRRLANLPQLGLVSLVYPGARHSRFEHSLGVYRNTLLFARQLNRVGALEGVSPRQVEALLLAALLHDIGHWPFCHPIEDLAIAGIPSHESVAADYIQGDELSELIRNDWQATPSEVVELLVGSADAVPTRILQSILSGPIDVDKMDYLYRDSLHAGVPYGRNFDAPRLIGSLVLNRAGDGIAITGKGRTAAELMVFARYVMFSEVYWHHAVRSATAMFQRAFYDWFATRPEADDWDWIADDEAALLQRMTAPGTPAASHPLLERLFGPRRLLHKRWASFSCFENEPAYRQIAQQPYGWLVECGARLAELLARETGESIESWEVLIDAPPVGLEVQFQVEVAQGESGESCPLGEISPVVNTLARRQFDDFVKQVRVFVSPRLQGLIRELDGQEWLRRAAELCEKPAVDP
ncbi:MAG: HD domain-containing protein [Mariniblastus sp.]|nr:HD domain-containing protein [Mariniblastus sp.]